MCLHTFKEDNACQGCVIPEEQRDDPEASCRPARVTGIWSSKGICSKCVPRRTSLLAQQIFNALSTANNVSPPFLLPETQYIAAGLTHQVIANYKEMRVKADEIKLKSLLEDARVAHNVNSAHRESFKQAILDQGFPGETSATIEEKIISERDPALCVPFPNVEWDEGCMTHCVRHDEDTCKPTPGVPGSHRKCRHCTRTPH